MRLLAAKKNFFFEARGNTRVAEGGALEQPRICLGVEGKKLVAQAVVS